MTSRQNYLSFTELDTTATEMRGDSLLNEIDETEIPDVLMIGFSHPHQSQEFQLLKADNERMARDIARLEEKIDELGKLLVTISFAISNP